MCCCCFFFSSWGWYKTWVKWEWCSVMTIRMYELGTQFLWHIAQHRKSFFVPSFTCLKKKMSPFFPNLPCWENSYLQKSRNSCLLMDHSRRINTAVWAEDIFHSCATCFSIFCPVLWIIKCVCESKHQAITLLLPAWGITLWGILVIHIFWAMCNAVLYWIKWVQNRNMDRVYFSH